MKLLYDGPGHVAENGYWHAGQQDICPKTPCASLTAVLFRPNPAVLPSMRRWRVVLSDGTNHRFATRSAAYHWADHHGVQILRQEQE